MRWTTSRLIFLALAGCAKPDVFTMNEVGFVQAAGGIASISADGDLKKLYSYDKKSGDGVGFITLAGGYISFDAFPPEKPSSFTMPFLDCLGYEQQGFDHEKNELSTKTRRLLCVAHEDAVGFGYSNTGTAYKPAFKKGEVVAVTAILDQHTGEVLRARYSTTRLERKKT